MLSTLKIKFPRRLINVWLFYFLFSTRIPGLDERRLPSDSLIRKVIERRADGLSSHGYRLVLTSRPCNIIFDLLRQPGLSRLVYHLTGFSLETRDKFLHGYVKRRHNQLQDALVQRTVLALAGNLPDQLTRLPLMAILPAVLLPTMNLEEAARNRWELFNILVRGLLRRELPHAEAERVHDFRQLPPERQEAFLLLSDLALQGLLETPPKLVFKYADIVAKCQGRSIEIKQKLLETARSLMVEFSETDDTQQETMYYHFLHLSFQEYLAAVAVRHGGKDAGAYGPRLQAFFSKTYLNSGSFDDFLPFVAKVSKKDSVEFFTTLFSTINLDTTSTAVRHRKVTLIMMLQEMFPDGNDFTRMEYAPALELVARHLNREVAVETGRFIAEQQISLKSVEVSVPFCHAVRLLPDLMKVALQIDAGCTLSNALDALQHQDQLQSLSLMSNALFNRRVVLDSEMKSLTSLLQTRPLTDLKLWRIVFSADQLHSLAEALSNMKHSMKHLCLRIDGGEIDPADAIATRAILTAISTRHTNLSSLELYGLNFDRDITMRSLASFLTSSRHLQGLGLFFYPMSRHSTGKLLTSIQASTSLTAMEIGVLFPSQWSQTDGEQLRKAFMGLSYVAVHHRTIIRLDIYCPELQDKDERSIVEEVAKTKGAPHQLKQLSFGWRSHLANEETNRLHESLIQKEQLSLAIVPPRWRIHEGLYPYDDGIVEELPAWLAREK